LAGVGIGGGPSIGPTALSFPANCGGAAPNDQSFIVTNSGTLDLNWTMSAVTGPGAAQYTATAGPSSSSGTAQPGALHPGESSTVIVTAKKVPAGVTDPTTLAAQVTITTDVPHDSPHVISLGEVPLGDQLSVSPASLQFGQFPINTATLPQTLAITNHANPGSPAANLSLTLNGSDTTAYGVSSPSIANLAPGGGTFTENITFTPTMAQSYPATLAISTTDALCTPLPTPIQLTGTGTAGHVAVSSTKLTFGTDPSDSNGFVNCGSTGPAKTFTVSNLSAVGNQLFNITGLSLGKAGGPFAAPTPAAPIAVAIGQTVTVTVTPNPIPQSVANPNDASAYSDTLTLTTDAAGDSPHTIQLVMQPRGAIIADAPLSTTWTFGTTDLGSIGTFTSTISNTGNAPASVSLSGVAQPTIFTLANNPTTVVANGVTSIVGQFVPPSADGSWTDQGTLAVATSQAFCQTLPAHWMTPTINLSGSSSSSPPVTRSGDLQFPTTDCGSAAPSARAITLTNHTNQAYPLTMRFNSGKYYTVTSMTDAGPIAGADAGSGTLPASGAATIVVTPTTVTPGLGVLPDAAPYADNLLIKVGSGPLIAFDIPISWGLSGAVFALPNGAGPYKADTTTGYSLAISNSGNATANVNLNVQPAGSLAFSPAPPIQVSPGIPIAPVMTAASSDPACPGATISTVTFSYMGPVCQPLPNVTVHACLGTQ
jgi:hypothetical protein